MRAHRTGTAGEYVVGGYRVWDGTQNPPGEDGRSRWHFLPPGLHAVCERDPDDPDRTDEVLATIDATLAAVPPPSIPRPRRSAELDEPLAAQLTPLIGKTAVEASPTT